MKKLLKTFALALFVAVAGVALAACGGKESKEKTLTQEDVKGTYIVTKAAYTPSEGSAGMECETTLQEIKTLIMDGPGESTDPDYELNSFKLTMFEENVFLTYVVTTGDPRGQILHNGVRMAYWQIENNKLVVDATGSNFEGATSSYNNGKVVIGNIGITGVYAGTMTLTLEYRKTEHVVGSYGVANVVYRPDEDATRDGQNAFEEGEYELDVSDWNSLQEDYTNLTNEQFETKYDFTKEKYYQEYHEIFEDVFHVYDFTANGTVAYHNGNTIGRFTFDKGEMTYTRTTQKADRCTYRVEWDSENEILYITSVEPATYNGMSGEYVYTLYIVTY